MLFIFRVFAGVSWCDFQEVNSFRLNQRFCMRCNLHEIFPFSWKWEAPWWCGSCYSCFIITVRKTTRRYGKGDIFNVCTAFDTFLMFQADLHSPSVEDVGVGRRNQTNTWDYFHSRGVSFVHHRFACKSSTFPATQVTFFFVDESKRLHPRKATKKCYHRSYTNVPFVHTRT